MAWRVLHIKRLERGGTKEETERKQPGRKKNQIRTQWSPGGQRKKNLNED